MTDKNHSSIRIYLWIFGALTVLTGVTVAVSYLHLPLGPAIALAILIATLKASLVAAYFMHLRFERVLIFGLLAMTAFIMIILFIVPITAFVGITPSAAIGHPTPIETHDH